MPKTKNKNITLCACGCGEEVPTKTAKWKHGHNIRDQNHPLSKLHDVIGMLCGRKKILRDLGLFVLGKRNIRKVETECLDCGDIKIIRYDSLRRDPSCLKCYHMSTKLPIDIAARKRILNSYRARAKSSNIPFELTEKQFYHIITQPCHYCGINPHRVYTVKQTGGKFTYNGIDRYENSHDIGYTINNSKPCCLMCNLIKNHHSPETILSHLIQMVDHMLLTKK